MARKTVILPRLIGRSKHGRDSVRDHHWRIHRREDLFWLAGGVIKGLTRKTKTRLDDILFIYYIKKSADILGTQTEMNMKILGEFTKAGLDFAFPTQTHYTKQLA